MKDLEILQISMIFKENQVQLYMKVIGQCLKLILVININQQELYSGCSIMLGQVIFGIYMIIFFRLLLHILQQKKLEREYIYFIIMKIHQYMY